MKIRRNIQLYVLSLVMLFILKCGDKFDLNNIDAGNSNINITGDTLYIPINPVWEGFNKPQDIMVGREPFIYVADTENDRIVLLNLDGQVLGTKSIKKPVAIAQDYRLNLIVCARFDTLGQTYSAVYKIDLVSVNHQLGLAPIKRLLPQLTDLTQPQREYTGVAVFFNNSFYVSRRGPNNSNLEDPDNKVLKFIQKRLQDGTTVDSLSPFSVALLDPTGTGIMSANRISSLSSYGNRSYDFLLTLIGNNSFKVQPLKYIITQDFTGYQILYSPLSNDIMTPNVFDQPEGATVDNASNIYVTDAGKDSVFKFNSFGDELNSFGGPDVFDQPHGVAFFDKILYVADTGNDRILRFILSTEIQ